MLNDLLAQVGNGSSAVPSTSVTFSFDDLLFYVLIMVQIMIEPWLRWNPEIFRPVYDSLRSHSANCEDSISIHQ